MNASINAIGASPGVASALGVTPEAFLEADDAVRWSAVGDELRAMLQGVIAANDAPSSPRSTRVVELSEHDYWLEGGVANVARCDLVADDRERKSAPHPAVGHLLPIAKTAMGRRLLTTADLARSMVR